ncbi:rhodanese-like domain-containing protein [Streptomyces sp. NPDC087440]|uniref:sulfurtransferase n=1 Tax=Streptomyces sp. NPDC087440 TaxID=3365790 RepID=UPI0037F602F3
MNGALVGAEWLLERVAAGGARALPGEGARTGQGPRPGEGLRRGEGPQPGERTQPGEGTQPGERPRPTEGTQPGERLVVLDASVGAHRHKGPWIPGARIFDIDGEMSDEGAAAPHTMLGEEQFTERVRRLGVRGTDQVVVYDAAGIYSSARAWWMLRAAGFERVAVLDGGLPAWLAAGGPVVDSPTEPGTGSPADPRTAPSAAHRTGPSEPGTSSPTAPRTHSPAAARTAPSATPRTHSPAEPPPRTRDFTARLSPGAFVGREEVREALGAPGVRVLDARSRGRFAGTEPEPRPGLRGGHMPGAVNLPFGELQDGEGRMLPAGRLRERFDALAPDARRLVVSCGSGVTACVLALGAELAGYGERVSVYDGSWSEWGLEGAGTPVVVEEA